jgi:hypothetical protein
MTGLTRTDAAISRATSDMASTVSLLWSDKKRPANPREKWPNSMFGRCERSTLRGLPRPKKMPIEVISLN